MPSSGQVIKKSLEQWYKHIEILADCGSVVVWKVGTADGHCLVVKTRANGLDASSLTPLPLSIHRRVMQRYDTHTENLEMDETVFPVLFEYLPYYPGKNYREALAENPSPIDKFLWALEWLFVVRSLHILGIAHLDLKPENLMRMEDTNDTHAVLIDFDTALLLSSPKAVKRKTDLIGTRFYGAPEVFENHECSFASDVYSLCVMLAVDLNFMPKLAENNKVNEGSGFQSLTRLSDPDTTLLSPEQKILYRGLDPDPAQRPTLKEVCAAVVTMARHTRQDPDLKKFNERYQPYEDLLVILERHALKKKRKGFLARTNLNVTNDLSFDEKCCQLRDNVRVSHFLFFHVGNRTYDCLRAQGWVNADGTGTEKAPSAFRQPLLKSPPGRFSL